MYDYDSTGRHTVIIQFNIVIIYMEHSLFVHASKIFSLSHLFFLHRTSILQHHIGIIGNGYVISCYSCISFYDVTCACYVSIRISLYHVNVMTIP